MYETNGGHDGEEGQEIFKYCVTGIVLAGRLDIASDSDIMGSRYFMKNRHYLYKRVGNKCEESEERLERRRRVL